MAGSRNVPVLPVQAQRVLLYALTSAFGGFLLVAEEFTGAPWASQAYDFGMLMVWLPLVAVSIR